MSDLHCTYAFNDGFVRQGLISIYSLLQVTGGKVTVVIHIDYEPEELSAGIATLKALFPAATLEVRINDTLPQDGHPYIKHGRPYTHWMLPALTATHCKTLFVDGDTVFVDDPSALFATKLGTAKVAGSPDTPYEIFYRKMQFWLRFGALGRKLSGHARQMIQRNKRDLDMSGYINAGIALVDMPAIHAAGKTALLDDFKTYSEVYDRQGWTNYDQDWVNYLFGTQEAAIKLVDPRWNLLANLANPDRFWSIAIPAAMRKRYRAARRNPALYHFAGGSFKPWQTKKIRRPMTPLQKQALGAWYAAADSYRQKTGQPLPPMQDKIVQIAEKKRAPWDPLFS